MCELAGKLDMFLLPLLLAVHYVHHVVTQEVVIVTGGFNITGALTGQLSLHLIIRLLASPAPALN